uniref:Heparan-alpha-glucosaminide N-acetyltransferase n=1 Tax=Timema douglasi TaxID=61478 RepID=A0A7R8VJR8_TIMDO|nr:unnamed protein product [Timema douglasi]
MAVPVIVLDTKGRCNNSNLNLFMDEACLDVRSNALEPLTIWSLSAECEKDLGTPSTDGAAPMVRSELLAVRREKTRLRSLDVFRGFLWIMGVSMALSLRSQLRSSVSRWKLFKKVLYRSIILVTLGILLNSIANAKHTKSTSLANLRLPGVLQRIGLSYFIVATLETLLMKREFFFEYGPWLVLQDVLESWLQWLVILGLVATHTCLTFLLPVEGCPTGYLGPGGSYNYSSHPNCTGGAAGYIDRMVFRNEHLYQKPTCYEIYQTTLPYDPEGLLGTLTSILMVYLGVQAGRITLCYHYAYSRVVRWTSWAVVTGLLAGCLCNFSRSDGVVPVNKNLWSVSYVLATASLAFILQCILYIWVDVKRWMSCNLFRFAGKLNQAKCL